MKPMAPHPNIVGLVGCCTKSSKWNLFSLFYYQMKGLITDGGEVKGMMNVHGGGEVRAFGMVVKNLE